MSSPNEVLKQKILEIIEIVEDLPEKYSEKAFEILLSNAISPIQKPIIPEHSMVVEPPTPSGIPDNFVIPIEVRAFLQQYELDESVIAKIFIIENDTIFPTYSLKTTVKTQAQIQVSLLAALQNALSTGDFVFDIEYARNRCRDLKVYDKKNFRTYYRNNVSLFRDLDSNNIELSPDGKSELADVIREIIPDE